MSVEKALPPAPSDACQSASIHRRCHASNCTSANNHLFSLPSEKVRRGKWIDFIKAENPDWSAPSRGYLCYKHFTSDQFSNYMRWRLQDSVRLQLAKHAIPTIHLKPTKTKSILEHRFDSPHLSKACLSDLFPDGSRTYHGLNVGGDLMPKLSIILKDMCMLDEDTPNDANFSGELVLWLKLISAPTDPVLRRQKKKFLRRIFSLFSKCPDFAHQEGKKRKSTGTDPCTDFYTDTADLGLPASKRRMTSATCSPVDTQPKIPEVNMVEMVGSGAAPSTVQGNNCKGIRNPLETPLTGKSVPPSAVTLNTVPTAKAMGVHTASEAQAISQPYVVKTEVVDPDYVASALRGSLPLGEDRSNTGPVAFRVKAEKSNVLSLKALDDEDESQSVGVKNSPIASGTRLDPPFTRDCSCQDCEHPTNNPHETSYMCPVNTCRYKTCCKSSLKAHQDANKHTPAEPTILFPNNMLTIDDIQIIDKFYCCPLCSFRTQFPTHKLLYHLYSHDTDIEITVTPENFICKNCRKPVGCTHAAWKVCILSSICGSNMYCGCESPPPSPPSVDEIPPSHPSDVEVDATLSPIGGVDAESSESSDDEVKEYLQPTVDFFKVKDECQPYQCYFCEFSTAEPEDINQHIKSDHVDACKYSCKYCEDFDARRKAKWVFHMTNTHEVCTHILDRISPRNPLMCQETGMTVKGSPVYSYGSLTISKMRRLNLCDACTLKYQTLAKKKKKKQRSSMTISGGVKGSRDTDDEEQDEFDSEASSVSGSEDERKPNRADSRCSDYEVTSEEPSSSEDTETDSDEDYMPEEEEKKLKKSYTVGMKSQVFMRSIIKSGSNAEDLSKLVSKSLNSSHVIPRQSLPSNLQQLVLKPSQTPSGVSTSSDTTSTKATGAVPSVVSATIDGKPVKIIVMRMPDTSQVSYPATSSGKPTTPSVPQLSNNTTTSVKRCPILVVPTHLASSFIAQSKSVIATKSDSVSGVHQSTQVITVTKPSAKGVTSSFSSTSTTTSGISLITEKKLSPSDSSTSTPADNKQL